MNKIILLGMRSDPNLGDALIAECTEKLTADACAELGIRDISLVHVDVRGLDYREHHRAEQKRMREEAAAREKARIEAELNPPPKTAKEKFWEAFPALKRLYGRIFRERIAAQRAEKERLRVEAAERKKQQRLDDMVSYARKAAFSSIDNDTVAVIVVGGGMIKYKHQHLPLLLEPFVERADELDVPVMFNSVGVEGYDGTDDECRTLCDILARPCVKTVTTRDDIDTLGKYYVNPNTVHTALTPDPVCAVTRLYGEERKNSEVIGLGVVRGKLFEDHGVNVSHEQLMEVWKNVIGLLEQSGKPWRLFSNGLDADREFGEQLLESIGRADKADELMLPQPERPEQLVEMIRGFGGIISCRLHSAIIAHEYGVPAVEPVWNEKQRFFGEQAGMSGCFIELSDNSADSAALLVSRLEAEQIAAPVRRRLDASATYDEIKRFINDHIVNRVVSE